MDRFVIKLDGYDNIFDNHNDALEFFIDKINEHLLKYSDAPGSTNEVAVYDQCNLPIEVSVYFNYLYDERKISNDEIILDSRLRMLLGCLICSDPVKIKDNALKAIDKSYKYHKYDKISESDIDITINYCNEEISVELIADNKKSYLSTNAFIMDDKDKTYYFSSHQFCNTAFEREHLGTHVDLDLVLEKYKE